MMTRNICIASLFAITVFAFLRSTPGCFATEQGDDGTTQFPSPAKLHLSTEMNEKAILKVAAEASDTAREILKRWKQKDLLGVIALARTQPSPNRDRWKIGGEAYEELVRDDEEDWLALNRWMGERPKVYLRQEVGLVIGERENPSNTPESKVPPQLIRVVLKWENGGWKYDGVALLEPTYFENWGNRLSITAPPNTDQVDNRDPTDPINVLKSLSAAFRHKKFEQALAWAERATANVLSLESDSSDEEKLHSLAVNQIRDLSRVVASELWNSWSPEISEPLSESIPNGPDSIELLANWDGKIREARFRRQATAVFANDSKSDDFQHAIKLIRTGDEWRFAGAAFVVKELLPQWGELVAPLDEH